MNVEETNIQVTVEGPSSLSPVKFVIDTQNRFLLQMAEVWTRGWLSECLCRRSLLLMISFLLTSTKTCSQSPVLTGRSTLLWLNLLSGGREKGMRTLQRFRKGENIGSVVLGDEWIPFELLLFADPVPNFFMCVKLYLLFKPRLRSKYFYPTIHIIKPRLRESK